MVRLRIDKDDVEFPMIRVADRIPKPEQRVLAVIDTNSTNYNYDTDYRLSSDSDYVLQFCHIWDSQWKDDELNKVIVVAWLELPEIIVE